MKKKKTTKKEEIQEVLDKNMIEMPVTEVLDSNYMPYAMSVILSRAIPDVRDGLKPSHRKLLYTMYEKNLLKGPRMKSSTIAGAMMVYNPHGDAANYDTLVRLSKENKTLITPLIDNKGSMGKHYSRDRVCAASRYTEAKLMPIVNEFFVDLAKDGADMIDNYDGTLKEPSILPVRFPHVLCNPNLGIAVGMACNICSFNLREICEYTAAYIKDKKIDIHNYVKGPDFATGAFLLYNKDILDGIYKSGLGSFKMRSCYEIDEKNRSIIVTEIPFSTTSEAIIETIIDLGTKGKLPAVKDVRDESDISGLKIAIDYKIGTNPDELMKILYKKTPLEDSFSCNFNVLSNGSPRVMGINEILDDWIAFRIETLKRTFVFDINKLKAQLHVLYGLEKIIYDIDKVIKIIRDTQKDREVIPNLMNAFAIDEIQANYIADIKLRNINKEYIENRIINIKQLEKEIQRLETLLKSDTRIKTLIAKQLLEIAEKYGKDRETKILEVDESELTNTEDVIENYEVRYVLTKHHYLKKVRLPIKKETDIKLKEDDVILLDKEYDNLSEIIVMTDKGNVYKVRGFELEDCSLSDFGIYLPTVVGLGNDENIIKVCITKDFGGELLFIFENGKIGKIPFSVYQTKTKRKKLVNAYSQLSPLVFVDLLEKPTNILLTCEDKRQLIVSSDLIPLKTTKTTQGVQVARIPKTKIISASILENVKKSQGVFVCKNIPCAPKSK